MIKNSFIYIITIIFIVIGLYIITQFIPKEKTHNTQTALDSLKITEKSLLNKHKHDEQNTEHSTEIMPYKDKIDIPNLLFQPKTDDEKLNHILDAEYVPAYDKKGIFIGLKVSSLPERINTSLIEIKNGDIITQINGIKLINEKSFGVAIEQLFVRGGEKTVIVFDLDRNGTLYSVSLEVQP